MSEKMKTKVISLANALAPLKAYFNHNKTKLRLLVIVSPT